MPTQPKTPTPTTAKPAQQPSPAKSKSDSENAMDSSSSELDADDEQPGSIKAEYASAGILAFAIRDRLGPNGYSFPNNARTEAVVLMVAEKKKHTVLSFPTARPSNADKEGSASTAIRAFQDNTNGVFDFDMQGITHRMIDEMPKTHLLSRCFQQNSRFAMHFTQIPYLPNANDLFLKASSGNSSSRIEALFWVPLHDLAQAGKVKKAAVEANPGDPAKTWRRIPYYGFLHELLQNKKIVDKLTRLEKLVKAGDLKALPSPPQAAFFHLQPVETAVDGDNTISSNDPEDDKTPKDKPKKKAKREKDESEKPKKRKRDHEATSSTSGAKEKPESKRAKLE
jgi:hypothetical protein